MEQKLWLAVLGGKEEEVRRILQENKEIKVNWKNQNWNGHTPFYDACQNGDVKIVTMLLAHPDINVNQKMNDGWHPFLIACLKGNITCVQLLLKDARVNVNEPTVKGPTPLYYAAYYGHLEMVKWWIASGREMDLGQPKNKRNDAIGVAKENGKTALVSLLERFKANPDQTRSEIRKELKITDFSVLTPPKLTWEQYVAFLDSKLLPPSTPVVTPSPPSSTPISSSSETTPQATPTPTQKEKDIFFESLNSRTFNVEQMVKCPMCQRTCINPRTLPCLHTFCLECLGHQKTTNPALVHCRQCNALIAVPTPGGFASLECNSFIDSLLKSLQGAPFDINAVIKCDLCQEKEAEMHCVDCTENYCPACSTLHKRGKATASHKQIPLEEALAGTTTVKRTPRCQKHIGFEIDTYCRTCKESVCAKCGIEKHSGHQFIPLDQVTGPLQEQIVNYTINMSKKEDAAKKAMTTMNSTISQIDSRRTVTEKEIDVMCDSVVAHVEKRRLDLKQGIDLLWKTAVKEKGEAESATLEFREFRTFTEGLLSLGTSHEIAGSHKMIQARNEILEKLEFPTRSSVSPSFKFSPGNVEEVKQAISKLGAIVTQ